MRKEITIIRHKKETNYWEQVVMFTMLEAVAFFFAALLIGFSFVIANPLGHADWKLIVALCSVIVVVANIFLLSWVSQETSIKEVKEKVFIEEGKKKK